MPFRIADAVATVAPGHDDDDEQKRGDQRYDESVHYPPVVAGSAPLVHLGAVRW